MRRPLSILLLVIFSYSALVPGRIKDVVADLPGLVEHFYEHKAENPSITVAEFWEMHYGKGYAQHKKDHDHSKLPGKESCCHHHGGTQLATVEIESQARIVVFEGSSSLYSAPEYYLPSPYVQEIWHPPKTC